MATFPSISPTYGAQKSSQPKIKETQFGDGYSQRIRWGLNQNPKKWNLTWEVSETEADTIETFLNARANDGASFDWTPPDDSTSYKWTCYQWQKSIPYLNRASITATFNQVFEP
jgi:hypothetical protein